MQKIELLIKIILPEFLAYLEMLEKQMDVSDEESEKYLKGSFKIIPPDAKQKVSK